MNESADGGTSPFPVVPVVAPQSDAPTEPLGPGTLQGTPDDGDPMAELARSNRSKLFDVKD